MMSNRGESSELVFEKHTWGRHYVYNRASFLLLWLLCDIVLAKNSSDLHNNVKSFEMVYNQCIPCVEFFAAVQLVQNFVLLHCQGEIHEIYSTKSFSWGAEMSLLSLWTGTGQSSPGTGARGDSASIFHNGRLQIIPVAPCQFANLAVVLVQACGR